MVLNNKKKLTKRKPHNEEEERERERERVTVGGRDGGREREKVPFYAVK